MTILKYLMLYYTGVDDNEMNVTTVYSRDLAGGAGGSSFSGFFGSVFRPAVLINAT